LIFFKDYTPSRATSEVLDNFYYSRLFDNRYSKMWHNLIVRYYKTAPMYRLKKQKKILYFGFSTIYRKGREWYYTHFQNLNPEKLDGEASTDYF